MTNTVIVPDAFTVWRNPRLIVLMAVSAALYAAAYILFAPLSIHLIPGVLSIAIRGVLPLALGLLFGPAGAWGVGIGNTIGDVIAGSLGPGSPFAFVSNFLLAYLPYRFWRLLPADSDSRDHPVIFPAEGSRARRITVFGVSAVLIAAAATIPLAWGLNLLGFAPFRVSAISLSANFALGNLASGLLFTLIAPRIARLNITWDAIVTSKCEVTTSVRHSSRMIGIALLTAGGVSGLLLGLILGGSTVTPVVAGPLLAILVGAVLI